MKRYLPYLCVTMACIVDFKLALIILGGYEIIIGLATQVILDSQYIKENTYIKNIEDKFDKLDNLVNSASKNIWYISSNIISKTEKYFERFYFKNTLILSYEISSKKIIVNYEEKDQEILNIINNPELKKNILLMCNSAIEKRDISNENYLFTLNNSRFYMIFGIVTNYLFYILGAIELNIFIIERNFSFLTGLLLLTCYIIPMNYEKKPQKVYKEA